MSDNHGVIHEVDGIREEDNKLPRWWLATFFGAILFSVGYWQYFHTFGVGQLPHDELAADLRALKKGGSDTSVTNESLMAAASSASAKTGEQLFTSNCASCHGMQGEGKIGPNLTDPYWLHGGQPVEIHRSIADGWPLKGMPAWKPVLGPDKVAQLAAYILTLKNRNVPGKPPEGEKTAQAASTPTIIASQQAK